MSLSHSVLTVLVALIWGVNFVIIRFGLEPYTVHASHIDAKCSYANNFLARGTSVTEENTIAVAR